MELLEIRNLRDQAALDRFHRVVDSVYADDPVWAPASELIAAERLRQFSARHGGCLVPVVALDQDRPLARAAAIVAPGAVDEAGQPEGWIGFVECVPDRPDAAGRVLEQCEAILRAAGARSAVLPKVDSQLLGLLIEGFDLPHTILTNHHPPFYLELFLSLGYQIKTRFYTLNFTREHAAPVQVALPGYTTREFDRARLAEETALFHEVQRAIFADGPGYLPRTLEEDRALIESFLPFLHDDLVIIAQDAAARPVGLLVCLPDVYQALQGQPIDRVRIVSIGAAPSHRNKGIGALMGAHLMRNLLGHTEYVYAEGSWVRAGNVSPRNLARRFHARPGREFALLAKRLAG